MKVRLRARLSEERRCAICHDEIGEAAVCPRCSSIFHRECRRFIARCPSLGCDGAPLVEGARTWSFPWLSCATALTIVLVIAAIAIPNLVRAKHCGNEGRSIGALKTIATCEAIFREGDKEHDGNFDYGMLSELNQTSLVDCVLGSGTKNGYLFQAAYSQTSSEFLWFAVANPVVPCAYGDRYFATNQAGVIYYTTGVSLALDTGSCALPRQGVLPCGR